MGVGGGRVREPVAELQREVVRVSVRGACVTLPEPLRDGVRVSVLGACVTLPEPLREVVRVSVRGG